MCVCCLCPPQVAFKGDPALQLTSLTLPTEEFKSENSS